MVEVLEAVERLRVAAGDQATGHHVVRVGTVSAATATLLVPAMHDFRSAHPGSTVEVVNSQQAGVNQGVSEGALDLGLVNVLAGDDPPVDLVSTGLVHGRPVVVLPADHPLTAYDEVTTDQLRAEPFVAMREGSLMHRFVHRLFGSRLPSVSYTTDGSELGKVMVAQGLGLTVLPDYSVAGDPMERAGLIAFRRLADDTSSVSLVLRKRRQQHVSRRVRDLETILLQHARAHAGHPERSPGTDRSGTDGPGGTSQSA